MENKIEEINNKMIYLKDLIEENQKDIYDLKSNVNIKKLDKYDLKEYKNYLFYHLDETNKKIIEHDKFYLKNLNALNLEQMKNHIDWDIMILKNTKEFIIKKIKEINQ